MNKNKTYLKDLLPGHTFDMAGYGPYRADEVRATPSLTTVFYYTQWGQACAFTKPSLTVVDVHA